MFPLLTLLDGFPLDFSRVLLDFYIYNKFGTGSTVFRAVMNLGPDLRGFGVDMTLATCLGRSNLVWFFSLSPTDSPIHFDFFWSSSSLSGTGVSISGMDSYLFSSKLSSSVLF